MTKERDRSGIGGKCLFLWSSIITYSMSSFIFFILPRTSLCSQGQVGTRQWTEWRRNVCVGDRNEHENFLLPPFFCLRFLTPQKCRFYPPSYESLFASLISSISYSPTHRKERLSFILFSQESTYHKLWSIHPFTLIFPPRHREKE